MFAISDKVVYVGGVSLPTTNENPDIYRVAGFLPERNQVYVIEGFPHPEGIRLVGSTVFDLDDGDELGWNSRAFRKLTEVKAENTLRAAIDQVSFY